MANRRKQTKFPRGKFSIRPTLLVAVFVLASLVGLFGWRISRPDQSAIAGVVVGGIDVGGLDQIQIEDALDDLVESLREQGLVFRGQGKVATIKPTVVSLASQDVVIELIDVDTARAARAALEVGQTGAWYRRLDERLAAWRGQIILPLPVSVRRDELISLLRQEFKDKETPVVEPRYELQEKSIVVIPGSAGREFLYDQAINILMQNVTQGINQPVEIAFNERAPSFDSLLFEEAKPLAALVLDYNLQLTYETQTWPLPPAQVIAALRPDRRGDSILLIFDHNQLATQWAGIVKAVNREPRAARFELEDNRAVRFETPQTGRTLDLVASQERLQQTLTTLGQESAAVKKVAVPLVVSVTEPPLSSLAAEYGLRELIGVGKTSFAGSPLNRRHNIKIGAAKLNGLLIAPGETFSALAALRPFTLAGGYRAELVIKGNRTVPEVGGGLCQIGTTLFRTTLNSGLPVLARQNHSYRVPYYEPPVGMDATIYDPAPDFSFRNDTANHIFVKAYVEGDYLTVEFWGTKDGRVAHSTEPVMLSSMPAPATKYIETLDLKPGEKKCTEQAHPGARTTFTYTVTYADGKKEEREFKSYYRPWQAVCLVGVEKLQPQADPPLAESEPDGESVNTVNSASPVN